MSRFLIILAIIFGAVYIIRLWLRRKINSFISQAGKATSKEQPKEKEVIYDNGNIVVMKGEAKKQNENQ